MKHKFETRKGDSGSPILVHLENSAAVFFLVAIHTSTELKNDNVINKNSVPITNKVINKLVSL